MILLAIFFFDVYFPGHTLTTGWLRVMPENKVVCELDCFEGNKDSVNFSKYKISVWIIPGC
jgi:hypothetical protein